MGLALDQRLLTRLPAGLVPRAHGAEAYDAFVFSLPKFAQRPAVAALIVNPSIDPLSEKNRDLPRGEVEHIVERVGVPRDKPILLQVASYARSKDPLGVVNARVIR